MAFAIGNKNLHIGTPSVLVPNIGSTAFNQVVGTGTGTSTSVACPRWEYADYTSTQGSIPATTQVITGGIGDHQFAHQEYRARVYVKVPTYGTATSTFALASLTLALEAATSTASWVGTGSTGHSQSAYVLDTKSIAQETTTSTGNQYSVYLFGSMPIAAGAQYARVRWYNTNGATVNISSTAIDAIIEGI
jgi:hypothetical protein